MKTNLFGVSDHDKSIDIEDIDMSDWDSNDEDESSETQSGSDYEERNGTEEDIQ